MNAWHKYRESLKFGIFNNLCKRGGLNKRFSIKILATASHPVKESPPPAQPTPFLYKSQFFINIFFNISFVLLNNLTKVYEKKILQRRTFLRWVIVTRFYNKFHNLGGGTTFYHIKKKLLLIIYAAKSSRKNIYFSFLFCSINS